MVGLPTRLGAAMTAACALMAPLPAMAQETPTPEEAEAIAREAYIFTYPLVLMYRTMYLQAISDETGVGFGNWLHLGMSSPADTDIVTPNNDTPYSYAWIDVRAEPWVLTMPPIDADRFYTSQWDDLWGYVIGNVGSVDDGNDGVSVLFAAPGWEGDLPDGIDRVIRGETDFLGTLTRTQAFGADDMESVTEIQQAYELQPLSAFLGEEAPAALPEIDWMPWVDGDETTLKYWQYVAELLPYTTPHAQDAAQYEGLAALGIERGEPFDPSTLSPEMQDALQAGIDAAREDLRQESETFTDATLFFNTREIVGDDYLNRALGVYVGIFGNTSDISIYNTIVADADGELLDGSKHSYTMSFPAGGLPPDEFFWSLTMYKLPERLLTDNPIDRYSIGSATPGVEYGDGDSLTLYIGPDSPGGEKQSNWLPAPDGPFWLVLRNYGPDQSIIDGTYQVPAVAPVE